MNLDRLTISHLTNEYVPVNEYKTKLLEELIGKRKYLYAIKGSTPQLNVIPKIKRVPLPNIDFLLKQDLSYIKYDGINAYCDFGGIRCQVKTKKHIDRFWKRALQCTHASTIIRKEAIVWQRDDNKQIATKFNYQCLLSLWPKFSKLDPGWNYSMQYLWKTLGFSTRFWMI
jgi:hypothetical protein